MAKKLEPIEPVEKAEVNDIVLKELKKCEHNFEMRKSGEAKCGKCHFGIYLGPDDKVKNGHLYYRGKLVL